MDLEGRSARRPMPRQMDVNDWNMDADVRNPTSNSMGMYQRDRTVVDTRNISAVTNRRLSAGEELRSDVRNMLRPTNRYDSAPTTSDVRGNAEACTSSWRNGGATERRWVGSSQARSAGRILDLEPSAQRLQPRSIAADSRHDRESLFQPNRYRVNSDDGLGTNLSSFPRESERSNRRTSDYHTYAQAESSSIYSSPPREQIRVASPASTIRSEASTMLTSSPFTPPITDTPPSMTRSVLTPPYTPSSDDATTSESRDLATKPSSLQTVSRAATVEREVEADESEGSAPAPIRPEPEASLTSDATSLASSAKTSATLTPRQQREQLYDFRRDMRQVFARIDEMVDLHRDMFKSDALSGFPAFDSTIARETATFATDTFEQLTTLRHRFEEMTAAWVNTASSRSDAESPYREETHSTSAHNFGGTETNAPSLSSRISSSNDADSSSEEESTTAESSDPSSSRDNGHQLRSRARWEPALSAVTNDDDASSSSSSAPAPSDLCPSSLSSDLPTISRPSTASSSLSMTKTNVFDDFDKRMEEIRASLNAITRERPRRPPSPRSSVSSCSSISTDRAKSRLAYDPANDQNDESHENNARVGNHPQPPPWRNTAQPTSRQDREARLRELLRELQTTGEHLDTAASPRA